MKTLTELSGALIRMAAKAVAEAMPSLPAEANPAEAPEAPAPAAEAKAETPADAAPAPAAAIEAKAETPADAAPAAPKPIEPPPESEALKAALDTAVSQATGLSGDRLSRLRDALKVVGKRADDVRLVRVFAPDEKVEGATAVGGFQYLVDYAPASMKQVMKLPEKRGGKGGGRGPGGVKPNAAAGNSGTFSMDSVVQDRQSERGRFGAGRSGAKHAGSASRPSSGSRPGGRPGSGGKRGP